MSNVSHFVTSDNTTLDIVAKTGRGLIRATMESTSTSTAFVASADGVTELYDGLTIVLKNTVVASASGCTLKLNTLDAKGIWLSQSNSACTTHFELNTTYIFIYDATNTRWELQQGRDTNSNTVGRIIYTTYTNVTSGTNGLKKYSLFARTTNGKYTSFTTNSGTGTKTFDTTTQFDFSNIFYYPSGEDLAANSLTADSTLYSQIESINLRYSFSGVTTSSSTSVLTAKLPVYLCVTSDGKLVSPYYTQYPTSSTTTYYILLGYMRDSYRMDLLIHNPMYSYDGTSLKLVQDVIRTDVDNKVSKSGDTMTGDLSFVGSDRSIKCRELPSSFDYAEIAFTESKYSMGLYTYNSNGTISSGIKMDAAAAPSDRIILYPSASAWRSALGLDVVYYNEDDTITFNSDTYPCVGYVTSGQKDAYFDITMPKLGNFINTVSVSQFGCAVRLAQGGYLQKSNDSSNMLNGTIKITGTPKFKGNTLSICVNNPNKFIVSGNQSVFVTNNTPFVGYCQLSATFT